MTHVRITRVTLAALLVGTGLAASMAGGGALPVPGAPAAGPEAPAPATAGAVPPLAPPAAGVVTEGARATAATDPQRPASEEPSASPSALPARSVGPEGMPSRAVIDRYADQRGEEVDARVRAVDPWGQQRRERRESRRQLRREGLDPYGGRPGGFPGYPWGPVAPYYGAMPWSAPVAPVAPTRESTDEYFQRQHQAIDRQFHYGAPWTPYLGDAYGPRRGGQERALPRNPWAPGESWMTEDTP